MTSTQGGEGEFIRGFFRHLAANGCEAVALHGWRHGFDDVSSDVDLAVDDRVFSRMPSLMHDYCGARGWRLVQLFPHEDTSIYGICVHGEQARRVVAFDICSDYQKDGVVYLTASEIMGQREVLPWGGWRLKPDMEFRYRFCKASAKGKAAASLLEDSMNCGEAELEAVAGWLRREWQVTAGAEALRADPGPVLEEFRRQADRRRSHWRPRSWLRWAARVFRPSGLVVEWRDAPAPEWLRDLGHSCFRRFHEADWSGRMIHDLVRSTLCVCPAAPGWVRRSPGLFLSHPSGPGPLVDFLARRIERRFGLVPRIPS